MRALFFAHVVCVECNPGPDKPMRRNAWHREYVRPYPPANRRQTGASTSIVHPTPCWMGPGCLGAKPAGKASFDPILICAFYGPLSALTCE